MTAGTPGPSTPPQAVLGTPERTLADVTRGWQGLARKHQPERPTRGLDAAWSWASALVVPRVPRTGAYMRRARTVAAQAEAWRDLGKRDLEEHLEGARVAIRRGDRAPSTAERAAAVVSVIARRSIGLTPHTNQLAAALAMSDGALVELATGEGKTLVAGLVATLLGWRGRGVHVLTVNDYLAGRDEELMRPLYHAAGLTSAAVVEDADSGARKAAYASGVTVTTAKGLAGDLLRDQMHLGRDARLSKALLTRVRRGTSDSAIDRAVLRGLEHAVVDEADSILIDEAVTPVILSQERGGEAEAERYRQAAAIAGEVEQGAHYVADRLYREVRLTARGRDHLAAIAEARTDLDEQFRSARLREELITQALVARHFFENGRQYVIHEEKVVIVDESTGRLMPDRTWRAGLHQAVEAKEGIEVRPVTDTMARIGFQKLFRSYRHCCGMTGTAWEAAHELWHTYKLKTVRIPTNRPVIRERRPTRLFARSEKRWGAVVESVRTEIGRGRAVLVGTRSVATSQVVSELLAGAGIKHRVLNAEFDAEEADIVSGAGEPGRVTVATNMAGRGTDIKLDAEVRAAGGLHVIIAEPNASGRIDRQLAGRSARQGDPGSVETVGTLDDELCKQFLGVGLRAAAGGMAAGGLIRGAMGDRVIGSCQRRADRRGRQQRQSTIAADDQRDDSLGFAGREF